MGPGGTLGDMTFLPVTTPDSRGPEASNAVRRHLDAHGGTLTPVLAALLGHLPSFDAYTRWYELRDALVPFLGERAVALVCYAVADEKGCDAAVAEFGRPLVDSGENPDDPQVTETERLVLDWVRLIARDPAAVPDEVVTRVEAALSPQLRLQLVALVGQLVATTVVIAAGRIPTA